MACLVNSTVDSILEDYKLVNHDNILFGTIMYIYRNTTKIPKKILLILNLETILPNYSNILLLIKNYKKMRYSNEANRLRIIQFFKTKFIISSVTSSNIKSSTRITQCVATQTINIDTPKSLQILNASLLLKIDNLEKKNVLLKRNFEYNKKSNKIMKKVIRDNNLNIIIANVINEGNKDTTPCIANNTDGDNDCGGDCDDESTNIGGDDETEDVGGGDDDEDDMYDDDDDESENCGDDDDVDMCNDEHNDDIDENNVEGDCDKSSMHVDDDKSVSDIVDCNKIVSDVVDCNTGVSDIVDCNKIVTDILDCNKSNNIIHNYASSLSSKRIRKPNSKFL